MLKRGRDLPLESDVKAFLGKGTTFKGILTFDGTVRIDGTLEGDPHRGHADRRGRGGDHGRDPRRDGRLVPGRITGNIFASQRATLNKPAPREGGHQAPLLTVEEGSFSTAGAPPGRTSRPRPARSKPILPRGRIGEGTQGDGRVNFPAAGSPASDRRLVRRGLFSYWAVGSSGRPALPRPVFWGSRPPPQSCAVRRGKPIAPRDGSRLDRATFESFNYVPFGFGRHPGQNLLQKG